MSRKRVKFTQYSLDRFLNYGQYNESLFDTDIKNLEVRKRKTPSPHLSFITQIKIKGETKPKLKGMILKNLMDCLFLSSFFPIF